MFSPYSCFNSGPSSICPLFALTLLLSDAAAAAWMIAVSDGELTRLIVPSFYFSFQY